MKTKVFTLAAVLVLTLSLFAGALAAPGDAYLFPEDADSANGNSIQSMAAVGDTLYMLSYNGLYAWKAGDAEPSLVSDKVVTYYAPQKWEDLSQEDKEQFQYSVNMILESGGQLYGLNQMKGSLVEITATEGGVEFREAAVLDWSDMYIEDPDYARVRQVFSAAMAQGRLYLLTQKPDDSWDDYDLLAFDLATGAQTKVPAENVHAIAAYENGDLLCSIYDWDAMRTGDGKRSLPVLSVLSPGTGAITKLTDFPAEQVGGLSYDFAAKTVYIMGRGELYSYKPGGAFETAAYIPVDYPGDHMSAACISGGLYAIAAGNGSVHVRNTDPSLKNNRVLRIAGGYSDSVAQAFRNAHPEIPVLFVEGGFSNSEQIAQQMVSGSDSADLFQVSLSYGSFSSLRDKGFVGDLSGSGILAEAVSKMYPQYVKDLYSGGKLIAFPYRFDCYTLGYSPAILKEIGLEEPPRNMFELMDLYVDWVDAYSMEFPAYSLQENMYDIRMELLNNIFMGYLSHYTKTGEDLQFDTPLFRSLLAKLDEVSPILKELNPPKDGAQGGVVFSSSSGDEPKALFANGNFYPAEYNSSRGYLPLPLSLDENTEPAYFAQLTVMVMNPSSKNQDLAMKYLEYFAQNMPRHLAITFCPDDNEPVENPRYAKELESARRELERLKEMMETAAPESQKNLEESIRGQEEYISWREANRFSISPETIRQYRAMVPYICVDTKNINLLSSSPEALTLLQRFLQEGMQTDQFIREFDRKLQMMRMENR